MAVAERATYEAIALEPDHPFILAALARYHERWNLGPVPKGYTRSRVWTGIEYQGRVIAAFSERGDPQTRVLEVLDALCEPTRHGWKALRAGALRYDEMVQSGRVAAIRHTILWANKRWWRFILEQGQDEPLALVFERRKKGD